ncbi:MAG: hypothetical protein ACXIUO_01300 [Erythrobacter sp.]
MTVTPELLAAYADGQLEGADKARIEAAIAADPALASQVARHQRLRKTLAAHYAPVAEEPVPDRLAALLKPSGGAESNAEVISFAGARAKRGLLPAIRRWAPVAGPALAASLVLAIWQPWQGGLPEGYADPALARVLDTRLAATQAADADLRILLSFQSQGGDLCRAWRGAEAGGIACRDGVGWRIERQFALEGATSGDYRQAGSEADIMAAAQDMAVSGALDAEGEERAKAKGWQN